MQPNICHQTIGDMSMAYLEYPGDGPTVLILHATGFLPWLWHPIARDLAGAYRVIVPSLFDHRVIDPENGWLGWRDLAGDVTLLCDRLQLQRPIMVGHSMGAAVLTLSHTVHGLDTGKLVLIEPIFLPGEFYGAKISREQHPMAAKAIRRRNGWSDRDEAWAYFQSKSFFQSWDREVLSLYLAHGITGDNGNGLHLTCPPEREAALFMGSIQHDPWPELARVKPPVLVVEGGQSDNKPFIDLKRVAASIPLASYHEVQDAGHLIPMERPAETLRVIQSFLDG